MKNSSAAILLSAVLIVSTVTTFANDTTLLSAKKDINTQNAANDDEPTAFWALANSIVPAAKHRGKVPKKGKAPAGGANTVDCARKYIGKHKRMFDAAFILAIKQSDAIAELAKSNSASDTQLAAAALALRALRDFMAEEKAAALIGVQHMDAMGMPIKEKPARAKKKKAKKQKGGQAAPPPSVLNELLKSRDVSTVYFAIQATAYAADDTFADTVNAVRGTSPNIAAAQILYNVMIGNELTDDEIMGAASKCLTGVRALRGGPAPSFDINVPPMCLICQAIGELEKESLLPVLIKALTLNDDRIKMDALRAIQRVGSEAALPSVAAVIPHCSWTVLVDACATAGAIPSEKMVPVLIQRLSREKGRMRLDLVHALSCIAGEQKARDADGWQQWWMKNAATFKADKAASEAYRSKTRVQDVDIPSLGFFYGLNVYSDRLCYVIDSSLSMRGGRIDSLKQNLKDSINNLAKHVMFNLIDFGGDIEILYDGALTSDKKAAEKRIEEIDLSLATRSFCAMRQGMLIPEVDTIYFLSDGAPARDSMSNWQEIQDAILVMTRYCQTAAFCIDFDPSAGNQEAMIKLSDWNYGLHESVAVN